MINRKIVMTAYAGYQTLAYYSIKAEFTEFNNEEVVIIPLTIPLTKNYPCGMLNIFKGREGFVTVSFPVLQWLYKHD